MKLVIAPGEWSAHHEDLARVPQGVDTRRRGGAVMDEICRMCAWYKGVSNGLDMCQNPTVKKPYHLDGAPKDIPCEVSRLPHDLGLCGPEAKHYLERM